MDRCNDFKNIKKLLVGLCAFFIVLVVGMLCIELNVNNFNKKERTYSLVEPHDDIELSISKQAYWSKIMPESFIYPTEFSSSSFQQTDKDGKNISYGRMGASREEIIEAAKLAGAHEFIMELANGYDTYVGERGVKLSGGQKQRISIARVFLKNPPILILDEATSALDNESEILVGESLDQLSHGRTTITIAHRLTTIKNYDRIIVLSKEGIEEEGNHQELLTKRGTYYRLWNQIPERK